MPKSFPLHCFVWPTKWCLHISDIERIVLTAEGSAAHGEFANWISTGVRCSLLIQQNSFYIEVYDFVASINSAHLWFILALLNKSASV